MSRTYNKKIRMHVCHGKNTEFYRERRRRNRRVNRMLLNATVSQNEPSEVDENLSLEQIPKRDTWNEPTDGSWVETPETINKRIIDSNYDRAYIRFIKKRCRNLKGYHKILVVV